MSLPVRIAVPVIGAVLIVAALIAVLFMQLEGARALLSQQLTMNIGSGSLVDFGSFMQPNTVSGDEALLHLRKGDVFALRGEWKNAQEEYNQAVSAKGGVTALRKLAQAQLQRRDVRGAQTTLDQLRREGARGEDVLLLESIILLRSGEVAKARLLLEAAEDSPHKQYGLALLSIIGGDHETAKTMLQAASTGWEPVIRSYARTLLAAYDEYALFPDSPALHLYTLLGHSLAQVQECELALPLLSQVTHEQDDYRDGWIVQGFCELTTERFTESLASLERAYQLDPEKPEIQYFLARAYISKNDHANALTFLQYALRNGFQPEAEVRRLIAQQALEMGNASLALEQYEALTGSETASLETYTAYVTAALTANRTQEALVKAQEAVQKWPEQAEAFETLGWALAESDKTVEAKTAFEKALQLEPGRESAKKRLESLR